MRYKNTIHYIAMIVMTCLFSQAQSETVYINDKFQVGLHQEKTIDSVIIKLVDSGAALDVIKSDEPMSKVRDPEGVIGWVDNEYIVATEPGRKQLFEAEKRISELESKLESLASGEDSTGPVTEDDSLASDKLQKENDELTQLLKSERLRVGELQAETAELKNKLSGIRLPVVNNEMEKLQEENSRLLEQLSQLEALASVTGKDDKVRWSDISLKKLMGDFDWKKMAITIAVSLVIGIAIGVYVLDRQIRRRHGGFRI